MIFGLNYDCILRGYDSRARGLGILYTVPEEYNAYSFIGRYGRSEWQSLPPRGESQLSLRKIGCLALPHCERCETGAIGP